MGRRWFKCTILSPGIRWFPPTMKELQARIQEMQVFRTEQNLARHPELRSPEHRVALSQPEPKLVEIPAQSALPEPLAEEVVPLQPASRRKSNAAPRKRNAAAGKGRASPGRVDPKPADLSSDELRCLERYVARVNQLLAAQATRRAICGDSTESSSGTTLPSVARTGDRSPPASIISPVTVESLQQRWVDLELGVMREEPAEAQTADYLKSPRQPIASELDQSASAVPPAWSQAQQEATEIAEILRQLAGRDKAFPPPESADSRQRNPAVNRSSRLGKESDRPRRDRRFSLRRLLALPQQPIDRIGDALLWIVLAAVARVGLRLLQMAFPHLASVFTGIMLAPAILSVCLVLFAPRCGVLSIYRLFLLCLGLMVGDKL